MICTVCQQFMEVIKTGPKKGKNKLHINWCCICGTTYVNSSGNEKWLIPKQAKPENGGNTIGDNKM